MDVKFQNVEIHGDRLTITRDSLMLMKQTCVEMQVEYKNKNEHIMWLMAAGYIEAVNQLLAHFGQDDGQTEAKA